VKVTASRTTATIAGIWAALGASTTEALAPNFSGPFANLVFSLVFFLVPIFLFVVGLDYHQRWKIASWRHPYRHRPYDRQYWREFKVVALRAICWFLGRAVSSLLFSYAVNT
jgi:hypothetical protein